MRLEKWALIAEIASGIAVVVTLVLLVIGIRDNTNATRAAVYQELMSDLNQFNLAFADDRHISREWLAHFDRRIDEMGQEEASRLVMLNRVLFRIYDAAYHSYRNGTLGDLQWGRFQKNICTNTRDTELWSQTTAALSDDFIDLATCRED